MNRESIADIRKTYAKGELPELLQGDPISIFQTWLQDAIDAEMMEPTAMVLATATSDAQPSARVVLLKKIDTGFVFYSNYSSRKGQQIAENQAAALTFWWDKLERQVRIEGEIQVLAPSESDAYFNSRPRGSQLGAIASPQSQVVGSRSALEAMFAAVEQANAQNEVLTRPDNWGGYRCLPTRIEFWQGRPSRLHDRLCFSILPDGTWQQERLAP